MAYRNTANKLYLMKSTNGAVIARSKAEACYRFSVKLGRIVKQNEVNGQGRATSEWRYVIQSLGDKNGVVMN